jgi:hypothetical protein
MKKNQHAEFKLTIDLVEGGYTINIRTETDGIKTDKMKEIVTIDNPKQKVLDEINTWMKKIKI